MEVERKATSMKGSNHQFANWWRSLCEFAPVAIFLKTYSFVIMFWDIGYLLVFTFFAVFSSLLKIIRPPSQKSIEDEVVLIVGSSRGVGRELAIQLAKLNAVVVCLDTNKKANEELVDRINGDGESKAYSFICDVTKKSAVDETLKAIEETVGCITMLFHCCGVPSPRSVIAEPPPIQSTLNVSIVSHFLLLESILPKMQSNGKGHIVLLRSVAGVSGIKHQMPLSVSQFAVQGIFESVSEEIRLSHYEDKIYTTIVHIYPFVISNDVSNDIRLRIPSYFGTINSIEAARQIIIGVRRNYMEISIPSYLLYLGHVLRLLPRKTIFRLRELLDTGVDFG